MQINATERLGLVNFQYYCYIYDKSSLIYFLECDDFQVGFYFTGLPVTGCFIDRNTEMKEIEGSLLPSNAQNGRVIHIIYGLGGIGKTQLAIAYARKHQESYSAILWLNGNSKNTLLQGFAAFGRHASINPLPESPASMTQHIEDIETEAKAVLRWLALRGNRQWLLIVDNVDREYSPDAEDPQAYNILSFLPSGDHGSILITTRLRSLSEIGPSREIKRLNLEQAVELLSNRSGLPRDTKGLRYPFMSLEKLKYPLISLKISTSL